MELIPHSLARWARERGRDAAFTEVSWKSGEERTLTFGDLHARTLEGAARLRGEGVGVGDRIVIVARSNLETVIAFLSCLRLGAVAVPVAPSRGRAQTGAQRRVVESVAPAALVGGTADAAALALAADVGVRLTALDRCTGSAALDGPEPELTPDCAAYLQHTSGSTTTPRAVRVSHGNVSACCEQGRDAYEQGVDTAVTWAPLHHNMGLVTGLLRPVSGGYHSVLMTAEAFVERPVRWLDAITRHRATLSSAPDFGYAHCAAGVADAECDGLDLRSWAVARSSGETVRQQTLTAFTARFDRFGFRRNAFCPSYGLAEATLTVTSARRGAGPRVLVADRDGLADGVVRAARPGQPSRSIVSVGSPLLWTEVRVVDPRTRADHAAGYVGEVLVRAPQVAGGYWPAVPVSDLAAGGWLSTGDLGALVDGELYLVGRSKDVVVIRGWNHYPGDIEPTIEAADPAIGAAGVAVFGHEVDGEERLAAVIEVAEPDGLDLGALCVRIRKAVSGEHAVPLSLVAVARRGTLPKTASGKIRRGACREGIESGSLDLVFAWSAGGVAERD
jgi:acyl-CoA synthetase (AMP-forming)/AMP-acid ligase II